MFGHFSINFALQHLSEAKSRVHRVPFVTAETLERLPKRFHGRLLVSPSAVNVLRFATDLKAGLRERNYTLVIENCGSFMAVRHGEDAFDVSAALEHGVRQACVELRAADGQR